MRIAGAECLSRIVELKVPVHIWPRRRDWVAKVVRWLKREGDLVSKGEVIVELELEKVILGIESEYSGKIVKIVAKEGSEVAPDSTLALIEIP